MPSYYLGHGIPSHSHQERITQIKLHHWGHILDEMPYESIFNYLQTLCVVNYIFIDYILGTGERIYVGMYQPSFKNYLFIR